MGKRTQGRYSNTIGVTDDKTSSSFKLAHMFHVLDYHRWNYVKKVLAHKNSHKERNASDAVSDSKAINCENNLGFDTKIIENSQFEAQKEDLKLSTNNLSLPLSPQTNISSPMPVSPTKSSRASRIRKMIIKEVTKRKGWHRRSLTCPIVSELEGTTHGNQHLEIINERHVAENIQENFPRPIDEGNKSCDICSTMKIECRLGDKEKADHLFKDISKEAINHLPFKGKINKSASFNHSKEFLDTMCVLGMNKQFSLRVLDDSISIRRGSLLTKQETKSNKRKFLEKSRTYFPYNNPLSTKDSSFPNSSMKKAKSFVKENTRHENPNNSHSGQIIGRRFKDLRQKIKHLIKENRKERRRIAMDAIFHKVPYGDKVYEESVKDSPCVSIRESDSPISVDSINDKKYNSIRSLSLDDSMDKYCQLFESTSFGREENIKTPMRSMLRVMNENTLQENKKILGRIFSSPDLQVFFNHTLEDNDDHISYTSPDRRANSFNERKIEDVSNIDVVCITRSNEIKENTYEVFEDDIDFKNVKAFSSINNDEDATFGQGDTIVERIETSGLGFCKSKSDIIPSHSVSTILESQSQINSVEEGGLLEDSKLEEFFNESPIFSHIKVDEDGENIPFYYTPRDHLSVQLTNTNYEIEEFSYVRDILELSGYLGTQVLGTWYSSTQPISPSIFVELESSSLLDLEYSPSKLCKYSNHLLLFDMINEVILAIYERSACYWSTPLTSWSRLYPMPKGHYVLKEVWNYINWYMCCSRPSLDPSLDYITTRDLAKYNGWMNLQFDAECVGLEIEELIFEDILNEFML